MGHGADGRDTTPDPLDVDSAEQIARTLQALSAPTRLRILSQLRHAPSTVGAITESLGLEQSAVSHQLRLLRMMGLVTSTRSGRHITYALFDDHVSALLDEAVFHAEHVRMGKIDDSSAG